MRKIPVIICALASLTAYGQDSKEIFNPVQYAITSLAIAPDARGGGMGDIGAATEADGMSQYWNPAKYPFNIARAGVNVSYTPWLRQLVNDIDLAYVSGFYRIGDYNALSASLTYFSLGEVFYGNSSGQIDESYSLRPKEFSIDVAYSRMLTQNFSAAVALRFIYSDLSWDREAESKAAKSFAADIALYRIGYFMAGSRECAFSWGINLSNIGSKVNYGGSDYSQFLPTNLRLGIGFQIPFDEYNRLSIYADANKFLIPTMPIQREDETDQDYQERLRKDYYDVSPINGIFKSFSDAPGGFKEELKEINWAIGLEYNYNDRFLVRGGYHDESAVKGNRKYFSVGAGFRMSIFAIDASYVIATTPSNPLDQTMRFTLGFDLDGIKDLFSTKRR
ncbi:MAG: type IX secretion system outer membrane channel protein PorV [Bacteroidaceae bacterium]|nr:type IX secretion system outer membrane channel protein PorV [Bacteroidaceae bacterium]